MFHRKLKSGIYINNNLINDCQEDQHFPLKSSIPRMTRVSDLLPGHLSQMQEKMCVLNLNCHHYTNEYIIKSQNQAKSRELLKLSNDLIKRARIVF